MRRGGHFGRGRGNRKLEESKQSKKRESKPVPPGSWQLSGDVAHKDTVLPPATRRISRDMVDKQLIETVRAKTTLGIVPLKKISGNTMRNTLSTLERACLRIIISQITDPVTFKEILNTPWPDRYVPLLFRRVQVAFGDEELPFSIWKPLVQTFGKDTPEAFKTYTGLVFDDEEIFRKINSIEKAVFMVPTFSIITLLDLSNTAFQSEDIWKIRPTFSDSLVALRLDYCASLNDDSIKYLTRDTGYGEDNTFRQLELLSLRDCSRITDRSLAHIARLPVLKMLDLRGTSCAAAKEVLRGATRPLFFLAYSAAHLALFTNESLATIHARLQEVAQEPFAKPSVTVQPEDKFSPTPSVLVTELTRLDENKITDPRTKQATNPYFAHHHTYGGVYTTTPISADMLDEVGKEEAARGAAFRTHNPAIMQGVLSMAKADLNWKRWRKARTSLHKAKREMKPGQYRSSATVEYDNDSDLEEAPEVGGGESDSKTEALPNPPASEQNKFYAPVAIDPKMGPAIPEKNDLMLLRFFISGETHAENLSTTKRRAEQDDRAPVNVKKRTVKVVSTPFDDLLPTKAGSTTARPASSVELLSIAPLSAPEMQRLGPPGVVKGSISRPLTVHKTWNK